MSVPYTVCLAQAWEDFEGGWALKVGDIAPLFMRLLNSTEGQTQLLACLAAHLREQDGGFAQMPEALKAFCKNTRILQLLVTCGSHVNKLCVSTDDEELLDEDVLLEWFGADGADGDAKSAAKGFFDWLEDAEAEVEDGE